EVRDNMALRQLDALGPSVQNEAVDPQTLPGFAGWDPRLQSAMVDRYAARKSDEQRRQEAIAPVLAEINKAKSAEDLGSEDATLASAKAAAEKSRVPLTAGDENPMWAVQDAYRAQQKQIGANVDAATARHTAETQSDYNIQHPKLRPGINT